MTTTAQADDGQYKYNQIRLQITFVGMGVFTATTTTDYIER